MRPILLYLILSMMPWISMMAQVSINTDGSLPNPSAGLDVKFIDKGLLLPRLSSGQMNAIVSPPAGLMVFNTTLTTVCVYNGSSWQILMDSGDPSCGTVNYEGQFYSTMIIGTQCWMGENLNSGTRINGTENPANNGVIEKYCYGDNDVNCTVYGGLYTWNEMMNYTTSSSTNPSGRPGICPPGWHIPSDAEWCQLETYLDITVNCTTLGDWIGTNVGGKLKQTGTATWNSPNTGATNSSGFTALPGGLRNPSGSFSNAGALGYFWSSTAYSASEWFDRRLYYLSAQGFRGKIGNAGYSVRCLKD